MFSYKKIINWAMLICVIALSACSKYLDHPVENQAPPTTIDYTDLTQMYAPVSGAYKAVTRGGWKLDGFPDLAPAH